jgi:hypothetical protein
METATPPTAIKDLSKEIDAIHHANAAYWKTSDHTREAIAEYHQRQERLEEIRWYMARKSHETRQYLTSCAH